MTVTYVRDYVIEFLEDMYAAQNVWKTRRRQLIDFKSYFRFDEEVNSFWETADYETDSYPVSGKVASAVKWYQEKTAGMH